MDELTVYRRLVRARVRADLQYRASFFLFLISQTLIAGLDLAVILVLFTQVNSLALAAVPNLPPGTLPPVVLPFDPTSTTPVGIVAVDSPDGSQGESILYDVGRYEVRNMIMSINGAIAPVVLASWRY